MSEISTETPIIGSLRCPACDADPAEPKPARVIIVTEAGSRERCYDADSWDIADESGAIDIERTTRTNDPVVARYVHGAWLSVREDGALADDIRPKARRLQATLRQVAMADNGTPPEVLQHIARAELERSGWDEEDL